jgi:DNA-binding MarR family transcriptional regulator
MGKKVDLTDAQIAILEAMGHMDERGNTAADIAAEADEAPTTITRKLTELKDLKPSLVQIDADGLWVRTKAGEDAVLEDTLDEEL